MTHPLAALIAGVKVKPLVWEDDFADHPFGWYETIDCGDCIVLTQSGVTVGSFPTADAAHDAAQVDYEARTLAALEAVPVPDLVEAGKVAERLSYGVILSGLDLNHRDLDKSADTIRALIALATAQAAQIAGMFDADTVQKMLDSAQPIMAEACRGYEDTIADLQADAATLRAEVERLRGALERIDQWADAYPLEVFAEPDFAKADEVLKTAGLSLSAISASNMRHVIGGVKAITRAALEGKA